MDSPLLKDVMQVGKGGSNIPTSPDCHMSLPPKGKGECLLFGHADVSAVEKLGGKCYRVNRVPGKGGKKSKGNLIQSLMSIS